MREGTASIFQDAKQQRTKRIEVVLRPGVHRALVDKARALERTPDEIIDEVVGAWVGFAPAWAWTD